MVSQRMLLTLVVPAFAVPFPRYADRSREDVPASPCAPSASRLSSLRRPKPPLKDVLLGDRTAQGWSGPKFFLHELGVFNLSDRLACYREALGTDALMTDMDKKVLPNIAEHTTDVWALAQLRQHPGRIYDVTQADLHIIGSALGASFHAARLSGTPCGGMNDHYRRVAAILNEMRSYDDFKLQGGRNWLFIDTDWNWKRVLTDEFVDFFKAEHMLLATADHNISAFGRIEHEDTIVMPYKAHGLLDVPDPIASFIKLPHDRRWSFVFHGKMDRHGQIGQSREVLKNITVGLEASSVEDVSFYGEDPASFANVTARTALTMQEGTFCLVPAGDTASSRRLFDALAAGCVPIIFHQFEAAASNLPFTHSIDWTEIALFAGGLDCLAEDVAAARAWLQALWRQRGIAPIRQMQELGRKTFLDALSYRVGDPISAMLAEVSVMRPGDAL